MSVLAVKEDGTLWGWGYNAAGILGLNSAITLYYSSPVQVGALTNWNYIAQGVLLNPGTSVDVGHAVAVKTDGTLWTWGCNSVGGLGLNSLATLYYSSPVQVGALTTWKQVAASYINNSYGIRQDGTLWAWGGNAFGQLGQNTVANASSPVQVGALNNWEKVACGYNSVVALKTDGTLWSWGTGSNGILGLNNVLNYSSPVQIGSLSNWKDVNIYYQHCVAVKIDGTLWVWGQNQAGQLGMGVSGTVYYSSPVQVGSLTNWKQVACGLYRSYGVKKDGTLWSWGGGALGQLGNTLIISYSSPIQIGSLSNWKTAFGGYNNGWATLINEFV